jgi:hypothetical protein
MHPSVHQRHSPLILQGQGQGQKGVVNGVRRGTSSRLMLMLMITNRMPGFLEVFGYYDAELEKWNIDVRSPFPLFLVVTTALPILALSVIPWPQQQP